MTEDLMSEQYRKPSAALDRLAAAKTYLERHQHPVGPHAQEAVEIATAQGGLPALRPRSREHGLDLGMRRRLMSSRPQHSRSLSLPPSFRSPRATSVINPVRQGALQLKRLLNWCFEPRAPLLGGRQEDRHRLGVNPDPRRHWPPVVRN